MNILLTYALEVERGSFEIPGHTLHFCCTGVGKAAAALHTYQAAHRLQPDLVLGVGTAGTVRHRVGDVVTCARFLDRDLRLIADLGVPWELDFTGSMETFRVEGAALGCVSSGDTFQLKPPAHDAPTEADVYDMEAYGSAQACRLLGIPFLAVKYVTDIIGQNSIQHWEDNLRNARSGLEHYLRQMQLVAHPAQSVLDPE